jgi:hypothetical protein
MWLDDDIRKARTLDWNRGCAPSSLWRINQIEALIRIVDKNSAEIGRRTLGFIDPTRVAGVSDNLAQELSRRAALFIPVRKNRLR